MNDKPNSEKSNQDSFILVKASQKSFREDIKLTQSANLIQSVLINSLESQIANLETENFSQTMQVKSQMQII